MYINSPRIAFGPLKPHATFVKGSCEVHTHAGVCCVLCVCVFFFPSPFFFFVCQQLLELFFFLSPSEAVGKCGLLFSPIVHTLFLATGSFFFSPFFFACFIIYVLSFLCSVTLSTLLFTVVLSFFFFSLYIYDSVLLRTFFFFLSPFPLFFFLSTVAPLTLSRPISHVGTTVFFPPATLVRVSVCALHL